MGLDLSYSGEQQELARSVDGLCRRCGAGAGFTDAEPLPPKYWSGLADLGVLALGTAEGGGGALEIAAAMEQLGAHGAPGPWSARSWPAPSSTRQRWSRSRGDASSPAWANRR